MTTQLADICGQATIRALAMPPASDVSEETKRLFEEQIELRYTEASSLADAIIEYDAEMKLAEKDSAARTNRITAKTLVEGLQAESDVREELSARGIDPVGAATRMLNELTEKSRLVREACNTEVIESAKHINLRK